MATTEASFFSSTVGKKFVMGITGLIWAGFVMAHMLGNMLIFFSADAYNMYGHALTSGYFIYVAEAVLVISLLVHIGCAISLTRQNRAARGPQAYEASAKGSKAVCPSSKTMAAQGSVVLVFIISHIMTFKYGTVYQTVVNGEVIRDLYKLILEVFSKPPFLVGYIICLALLFFHLKHGVGSTIQSLGVLNDRLIKPAKTLSFIYATVVILGFLSQPIYAFFFAQ